VVELLGLLKDKGRFVKFIRLDNAVENASIERACKEKCLGIKFEFSAPRTPKRNRKVRESFRLYMDASDQCQMILEWRKKRDAVFGHNVKWFWSEEKNETRYLDRMCANILVNCEFGKTRDKSMFGVNLRSWRAWKDLVKWSWSLKRKRSMEISVIEAWCACLLGIHRIISMMCNACLMSKQGKL
jgi:hypothetical protein